MTAEQMIKEVKRRLQSEKSVQIIRRRPNTSAIVSRVVDRKGKCSWIWAGCRPEDGRITVNHNGTSCFQKKTLGTTLRAMVRFDSANYSDCYYEVRYR